MTKFCRNCEHKKGDHSFYSVSSEEGLRCKCQKCDCVDFDCEEEGCEDYGTYEGGGY